LEGLQIRGGGWSVLLRWQGAGQTTQSPPKKGGLQIREKKNRNGNSERNVRRRYFRALSPPCRAGGHLTTGISAFAPPKRIYPSFQFLRLGFSERILPAPNFLRDITTLQTLAPSHSFFGYKLRLSITRNRGQPAGFSPAEFRQTRTHSGLWVARSVRLSPRKNFLVWYYSCGCNQVWDGVTEKSSASDFCTLHTHDVPCVL